MTHPDFACDGPQPDAETLYEALECAVSAGVILTDRLHREGEVDDSLLSLTIGRRAFFRDYCGIIGSTAVELFLSQKEESWTRHAANVLGINPDTFVQKVYFQQPSSAI
jgi:hypothetical protein